MRKSALILQCEGENAGKLYVRWERIPAYLRAFLIMDGVPIATWRGPRGGIDTQAVAVGDLLTWWDRNQRDFPSLKNWFAELNELLSSSDFTCEGVTSHD